MRKILLVDGYNVINQVQELRPSLEGGLENARLRLAASGNESRHKKESLLPPEQDFASNRAPGADLTANGQAVQYPDRFLDSPSNVYGAPQPAETIQIRAVFPPPALRSVAVIEDS